MARSAALDAAGARRLTLLAVTGTPGVGKTTLAGLASAALGWPAKNLRAWAVELGAVSAHDPDDEADVIDVDLLAERIPRDQDLILDGHLAHLLDVDEAWVIRVDPEVLEERLQARGYSEAKVAENLEAEAMDLILQEAMDLCPRVIQRDGTGRAPEALLRSFLDAHQRQLNRSDLESVDWSPWLAR